MVCQLIKSPHITIEYICLSFKKKTCHLCLLIPLPNSETETDESNKNHELNNTLNHRYNIKENFIFSLFYHKL